MILKGRVVKLLPITNGVSQSTGNQWTKQEFLFGYYESPSDAYERTLKLDVMNERIQQLQLAEGDILTVRVLLTCREYPQGSGRYFNDVRTGDITKEQQQATGVAQDPFPPQV